MKALLLKEPGRLACEEVPAPEAGPDEALVAVLACGICGSDVLGRDGGITTGATRALGKKPSSVPPGTAGKE